MSPGGWNKALFFLKCVTLKVNIVHSPATRKFHCYCWRPLSIRSQEHFTMKIIFLLRKTEKDEKWHFDHKTSFPRETGFSWDLSRKYWNSNQSETFEETAGIMKINRTCWEKRVIFLKFVVTSALLDCQSWTERFPKIRKQETIQRQMVWFALFWRFQVSLFCKILLRPKHLSEPWLILKKLSKYEAENQKFGFLRRGKKIPYGNSPFVSNNLLFK